VATISIVWNWGTNSNINFNPATDILDFGWFAADQFTISEINGTVVIAIPSNHQTYTLQHTTLSELHLSNIVAKDSSAIGCRFRKLDSSVSVVEPAQDWIRDHVSEPLDRTCAGRVLPKRNVSSHFIVIGGVLRKNSSKVLCVDDDQMIDALAPDRPDQTLNISVLPGRPE
jgi:hypothetical protein